MADDINVTINSFYLFIAILIPKVEIQLMFNEATQNFYKISYDEDYTERRLVSDMIVQVDIGLSPKVNRHKYLIFAHQIRERMDSPNKKKNSAIFDNLDLRKFYVKIDSQR